MAQEQTITPSPGKTVRLVRPSVVLLCGPAACGKSTFAQHHFRPTQIISSDWARGRVCDDERDQRFQSQAFALVRMLTELRLSVNRLCVVDSTALTQVHRKEYLELARRFHVPCVVFLFNVPLEKCIERDRARERSVGSPVIERQHLAFEQTKTEIHQEGFDQVVELNDPGLDEVQIEIIFRPIPQPVAMPGRRSQGENRPAAHSWREVTGRGPAARETNSPSPASSPSSSPGQTTREVRLVGSSPKPTSAPISLPDQPARVAEPSAPFKTSVPLAGGGARNTSGGTAVPQSPPQGKQGGQSNT